MKKIDEEAVFGNDAEATEALKNLITSDEAYITQMRAWGFEPRETPSPSLKQIGASFSEKFPHVMTNCTPYVDGSFETEVAERLDMLFAVVAKIAESVDDQLDYLEEKLDGFATQIEELRDEVGNHPDFDQLGRFGQNIRDDVVRYGESLEGMIESLSNDLKKRLKK